MNNVIAMAVVQGTSYLASKLARDSFPQTTVANNVIKHLTTVDILKDHVVVVGMDNHLPHAAYIRVMEEHRERRFANGSNFLGGVFRGLASNGVRTGITAVLLCRGIDSGKNFDGELVC